MNAHNLSCCCWALADTEDNIPARLADVGFRRIDLRPADIASEADLDRIERAGLSPHCMAASFGIPEGASLSSADPTASAAARSAVIAGLERAAELEMSATYIVPDFDTSAAALARFADSMVVLADRAAQVDQKLMIEHFPGRSLPTVAATLKFLRDLAHPSLYLLYDIGHVQISGESIRGTVLDAGPLLGYVHLDDNDGEGDLHWALLDGVMEPEALRELFDALGEIGFSDGVSIELSPKLSDPLQAIRRSWKIVHSLYDSET